MFEKTQELLDIFLRDKVPGYEIAVYKDGKCLTRRSGGYVDLENQITHKGDELYFMYSTTKLVTVVLAMMLYEQGKFKLDDRLSQYLPEYAEMQVKTPDGLQPAKNPILVEQVLCMTAGFHYSMGCPSIRGAIAATEGRCPTREIVRAFAAEPLEFEPGTSWKYSFGHDVLGALVELLAGKRLAELAKEWVFIPAGMKRATMAPTAEEMAMICPQYKYNYSTKEVSRVENSNVYMIGPEFDSGGAGMVCTLDDLICLCEALRTGKLLKPETIKLMTEDRLGDGAKRENFTLKDYGYGLGVRCPKGNGDESGPKMYDFGWSGAAGSHVAVDVENGITIAHVQHILNFPNYESKRRLVYTVTSDVFSCPDEVFDVGKTGEGITY